MKLIILSRSRAIPSTKRLTEAAKARGHEVRVVPPGEVDIYLEGPKVRLTHLGEELAIPEVVIPRIPASLSSYGLSVLDQLTEHGAVTLNSANDIYLSRNPLRCLRLLATHGLDTSRIVMSRNPARLKALARELGGPPVLVKLLQSDGKRGLMVCESRESLEAALEAVLGLGHNIVLQEYVRDADQDLRVLVVGGKALAAVRRTVRALRVSLSLSYRGKLVGCPLPKEAADIAEAAARLLRLEVCGVDLIRTERRYKVFQVNASPELSAMEAATGVELSSAIIERSEQLFRERG